MEIHHHQYFLHVDWVSHFFPHADWFSQIRSVNIFLMVSVNQYWGKQIITIKQVLKVLQEKIIIINFMTQKGKKKASRSVQQWMAYRTCEHSLPKHTPRIISHFSCRGCCKICRYMKLNKANWAPTDHTQFNKHWNILEKLVCYTTENIFHNVMSTYISI